MAKLISLLLVSIVSIFLNFQAQAQVETIRVKGDRYWNSVYNERFYDFGAVVVHMKENFCNPVKGYTSCEIVGQNPGFKIADHIPWWGFKVDFIYTVKDNPAIFEGSVGGMTDYDCPTYFSPVLPLMETGLCQRELPSIPDLSCKDKCDKPSPKTGNPFYLANGQKVQVETDYSDPRQLLSFTRTYTSNSQKWLSNFDVAILDFANLTHNGQQSCVWGLGSSSGLYKCFKYAAPIDGGQDIVVLRPNGQYIRFAQATGYGAVTFKNYELTQVMSGTTKWKLKNTDTDVIEEFNAAGKMTKINYVNGTFVSLDHSRGNSVVVTDNFGRTVILILNGDASTSSFVDPSGGVYRYSYDMTTTSLRPNRPEDAEIPPNLSKVEFPDGKTKKYYYGDLLFQNQQYQPKFLMGIEDESGRRISSYTYRSEQIESSSLINGTNRFKLIAMYPATVVENPDGTFSSFSFITRYGTSLLTSFSRLAQTNVVLSNSTWGHDANGNIASYKNANGYTAYYTYDLSRNLETKRVKASGTPEAKTTSTIWHANYRIPVQIDEPLRRTTYTHDVNGNVLTKTEQATNDANGSQGAAATVVGTPRIWNYTYNSVGQVLTATGPRTDVLDRTTYTYDTQGNLTSVTNGAGHVTTMSNYDPHGKVQTITDPNGVVTNLTYHVRGWLLSRAVIADSVTEKTNYDYDDVGQMTKVTMPDNSEINYVYDDARRLTKISDHLGNSINYTLDNMGNRINETTTDATGALSRKVTRVYDQLNRLKEVTGAAQ